MGFLIKIPTVHDFGCPVFRSLTLLSMELLKKFEGRNSLAEAEVEAEVAVEVEGMNSLAEDDSEDFFARDIIDESLFVQDKFD